MQAVLNIKGLCSGYDGAMVIRDISLEVFSGELIVIIGANGAGKSTLLKTISGLIHPYSGEIVFDGRLVSGLSAHEIVKYGISYCPEGRRVFPELTVMENLMIGAYCRSRSNALATLEQVYSLFPILLERKKQLAGSLSGGEQQMLAIGRSLMTNPKLILFDEPSLGLAPVIVDQVMDIIEGIRERGVTVVLVEQNAQLALEMADRGYVMENGTIGISGTGKELLHDERIQEAYLGI